MWHGSVVGKHLPAVPGEVGGVGVEGGLGLKDRRRPWRSERLKWLPPGRMDSEMSDLATRMRWSSSMVQSPASKRSRVRDEKGSGY